MMRKDRQMPNIAKLLKDEIQRLARKEVKTSIAGLRKDNSRLKRTAADFKRRLATLESVQKRLAARTDAKSVSRPSIEDAAVKSARITGKMIRSIRKRLGISQDAFARLVGVSSQTVYMWEHKNGRIALRGKGKAAIVGIRKLGKREVKKMLSGSISKR
jgi:DNA-binding transcriptional regulator YiaG